MPCSRLLSPDTGRYRRQILALQRYPTMRECSVLLIDANSSELDDLKLNSNAKLLIITGGMLHNDGGNRQPLRNAKRVWCL